jgi:hypothetical protein
MYRYGRRQDDGDRWRAIRNQSLFPVIQQDVAVEFPQCEVFGVDTKDIFPALIKPANTTFKQVKDIDKLPFETKHSH